MTSSQATLLSKEEEEWVWSKTCKVSWMVARCELKRRFRHSFSALYGNDNTMTLGLLGVCAQHYKSSNLYIRILERAVRNFVFDLWIRNKLQVWIWEKRFDMNLFSSFFGLWVFFIWGVYFEFFNFISLVFYEKCEEYLWDDEGWKKMKMEEEDE